MSRLLKNLIILGLFIPISGITSELPTDLKCLTANIFFEARGESLKGMKAVADVTLNRASHPSFPDSICEVVKQPSQFSWIKGDKRSRKVLQGDLRGFKVEDVAAYRKAEQVATEALVEGYKPMLPKWVVSFHNRSVQPKWSTTMRKYRVIGSHSFYGFKKGK